MAIDALSGPYLPAAKGAPTAAVIILHGYGANGDDLVSLAPFFAQALPHVIFYAPNAPQPWEGGGFGGRQWFGLPGYDPMAMQRDPNLRTERFKAMTAGAAAAGDGAALACTMLSNSASRSGESASLLMRPPWRPSF